MRLITLILALFVTSLISFGQKFDLVIKNAKVFNTQTGILSANQTILIKGGIITQVTGGKKRYAALHKKDAMGKLVTLDSSTRIFIPRMFIALTAYCLCTYQKTL